MNAHPYTATTSPRTAAASLTRHLFCHLVLATVIINILFSSRSSVVVNCRHDQSAIMIKPITFAIDVVL